MIFFLFTRNFFFIKYNDFILLPGDSILAISLNVNSIGFLHFGIDITSDYLCWNICQVVESDIHDSVYIGIQCIVLKIQFIDFFHLFYSIYPVSTWAEITNYAFVWIYYINLRTFRLQLWINNINQIQESFENVA